MYFKMHSQCIFSVPMLLIFSILSLSQIPLLQWHLKLGCARTSFHCFVALPAFMRCGSNLGTSVILQWLVWMLILLGIPSTRYFANLWKSALFNGLLSISVTISFVLTKASSIVLWTINSWNTTALLACRCFVLIFSLLMLVTSIIVNLLSCRMTGFSSFALYEKCRYSLTHSPIRIISEVATSLASVESLVVIFCFWLTIATAKSPIVTTAADCPLPSSWHAQCRP